MKISLAVAVPAKAVFIALMLVNGLETLTETNFVYSQERNPSPSNFLLESNLKISVVQGALSSKSGRSAKFGDELELTETQKDDLRNFVQQHYSERRFRRIEFNVLIDRVRAAKDKKLYEKLKNQQRETLTEMNKSMLVLIEGTLLPHQLKRLDQVAFQYLAVARYRNSDGPFTLVGIVESLDNTSWIERRAFRTKVEKLEKEYEEELKLLRKKYEERAHSALPSEIKDRVNELIGDILFW